MPPISLEIKYDNSNARTTIETMEGQQSTFHLGNKQIDLTGFKRGGEAVIINRNPDSIETPETIIVRKNHSKSLELEYTHKHNVKDTAKLRFLGK